MCVYVRVDWWGHSREPGLLTTSSFPFPSAPVPPSHRSAPSSFNLAAEAKESGSESHQGTLPVFKHHTHASFSPLSSPCLFILPSLLSPPPCSFVSVLTSPASPASPRLSHAERQSVQPRWCKTPCHLCFVLPTLLFFFFSLNQNSSNLSIFSSAFELIWNLESYWDCHQGKPSLTYVSVCLFFFFFLSGYPLMSVTLQPLPLLCSHFTCFRFFFFFSPELVNSELS